MIRRLRAGDEPLNQEVCRLFKERVPSDAEARRFLERDDVVVFAALDGERPVGFAYGYVLERIDGDRSVFLYELGVDETRRRRGLGRRLAEAMREVAVDARAVKMWVQTDEANEPAKRTYASAGAARAGTDLTFLWRFSR